MSMGDNIRIEEEAKVDGLRAVNNMLRDENRRLREALEQLANGLDQHCDNHALHRQFVHDEEWWVTTKGDHSFYRWFAYRALTQPERKAHP